MRRILLGLLLGLVLCSCHRETFRRWGSAGRGVNEVLPVTVQSPEGRLHGTWSAVLTDLLSRRGDVRLVKKEWRYALWVEVQEGQLSLIAFDNSGKVAYLGVLKSTRFLDRQQGAGRPEGAATIIKALQKELDGFFRAGGGS